MINCVRAFNRYKEIILLQFVSIYVEKMSNGFWFKIIKKM